MKVTPFDVTVKNPCALWARFDPRYQEVFSEEEIFPDFIRTLWAPYLKVKPQPAFFPEDL